MAARRQKKPANTFLFEEWECDDCGKLNYIGRSVCKKCGSEPSQEIILKRKRVAPTPADEVEEIIKSTLFEVTGLEDASHHRADLFQSTVVKHEKPRTRPIFIPETLKGPQQPEDTEEDDIRISQEDGKIIQQFIQEEEEGINGTHELSKNQEDILEKKEGEGSIMDDDSSLDVTNGEGENIKQQIEEEEVIVLECSHSNDEEPVLDFQHQILNSTMSATSFYANEINFAKLPPGTIDVCNIECSSFEIRWEPPIQDRPYDSFRIVFIDQNRQVIDVVTTKKKRWIKIGLDPGCQYHVAVTCRAIITTKEGQKNEHPEVFYIPQTTVTTSVKTLKQTCEFGYWFDGQINTPFYERPFKLFLGTINLESGKIIQETKLGFVEMAVRYGMRGSPEEPVSAHKGITAYELFSPYSLGVAAVVEFEVEKGSRSIYEIELWVKQHNPREEDYDIAPTHVQQLAYKLQSAELNFMEKMKTLNQDKNLLLVEEGREDEGGEHLSDLVVIEKESLNETIVIEKESLNETIVIEKESLNETINESVIEKESLNETINQSVIEQESLNETINQSVIEQESLNETINESIIEKESLNETINESVNAKESLNETINQSDIEEAKKSLDNDMFYQQKSMHKNIHENSDDDENYHGTTETTTKTPSQDDLVVKAMNQLEQLRESYLDGGTYLYAQDRKFGTFVKSKPAKMIGQWEKLTLRTEFKSTKMKFCVQVPANYFGSVLIDSFKVSYLGPSELELKIADSMQWLEIGKGGRTQALQLNAICAEDLITASGGTITSPVFAKIWFNGQFLAQTDISLGGGIDPQLNGTFKIPLVLKKSVANVHGKEVADEEGKDPTALSSSTSTTRQQRGSRAQGRRGGKIRGIRGSTSDMNTDPTLGRNKGALLGSKKNKTIKGEEGLKVEVFDAFSNAVIGRLEMSEKEVLQHEAAPTPHVIVRKHRKAKGCLSKTIHCLCSCVCRVCKKYKENMKVTPSEEGANKDETSKDDGNGKKGKKGSKNKEINEDKAAVVAAGVNPLTVKSNDDDEPSDDMLDQMESGNKQRHEMILVPRGRVVLSVAKLIDVIPDMSEVDDELVTIRNAMIRKEKKTIRLLAREVKIERRDVDALEYKCKLIRFGIIDVAVTLLTDPVVGPIVADMLKDWAQTSEDIDTTQGGSEVRRLLRLRLHHAGVLKAVFMQTRSKTRQNRYSCQDKHKVHISPELFRLINDIYISNRNLLLQGILEKIDIFEMIVRCIPDPLDPFLNKKYQQNKETAELASRLLEEVGLGKTMPDEILSEYFRLRRIIPLDERFWRCEALQTLPLELPKRLLFTYDHDRILCLPPEQPEMTSWELFLYYIRQSIFCLFILIIIVTGFSAVLSLLRNGITCNLTLAAFSLSLVSCLSVVFLQILSKMAKLGVGSQIAIICCPFVCCNMCCLVGSLIWAVILMFVTTDGLEECDVGFLTVTRMLLAFLGLGIVRGIIQSLIIQSSRLYRCCCTFKKVLKERPRTATPKNGKKRKKKEDPSSSSSPHQKDDSSLPI